MHITIPLYILYEFAILTGIIVERRKAIREWKNGMKSWGPKPDCKTENSSSLFYLVILIAIGLISFAAWKYKDRSWMRCRCYRAKSAKSLLPRLTQAWPSPADYEDNAASNEMDPSLSNYLNQRIKYFGSENSDEQDEAIQTKIVSD